MLEKPEYEAEFYLKQNEMMELRYEKIFETWSLSWNKYINAIYKRLNNNPYWIWVYLCGFHKFVKEEGHISEDRHSRLYQDMNNRIYRIIGDYYQVKRYVEDL
jgi:hypothetical protein